MNLTLSGKLKDSYYVFVIMGDFNILMFKGAKEMCGDYAEEMNVVLDVQTSFWMEQRMMCLDLQSEPNPKTNFCKSHSKIYHGAKYFLKCHMQATHKIAIFLSNLKKFHI